MTSTPKTSPLRTLLTLAWPIVISRSTQTVVSLSDTLLVAHLGAAALAATATGGLNASTILIFPMGITFIVQSYAAQLLGKGDLRGARRYGWYGLLVALLTEVACLAAWPFIDDALSVLNATEEVRVLMASYLKVRLLTGGAAIGIEALGSYYGGLGRTRPSMIANLTLMVLNVLLNWVLINGRFGAPALGVTGSALASALSTAIAFAGFLTYFLRDRQHGAHVKLAMKELLRMLRFGLPEGMTWLFEFGAFVFFANIVVAGLGTAALAAMNSVFSITSVGFMPAFGLASSGAILVGQAIGSGRKDDVPGLVKLTSLTAMTWQGLAGVICLLFPHVLISAFAEGEGGEEVAILGARVLMLSAAWQLFDAMNMTLGEALRGAGDTLYPMMARIMLSWLIFVPGSYFSVKVLGWGEVGAASWFVVQMGLLSIALVARFRSGKWRSIELVEHPLPV